MFELVVGVGDVADVVVAGFAGVVDIGFAGVVDVVWKFDSTEGSSTSQHPRPQLENASPPSPHSQILQLQLSEAISHRPLS